MPSRWIALVVALSANAACPPGAAPGPSSQPAAGPKQEDPLWGEVARVKKIVDDARENGAERCAPVDLSRSERALLAAAARLKQGEREVAERELKAADVAATRAFARSPRLRCSRPLEKSPQPDSDGDGIPNDVDRCPDDPEDRDGFQDQDGCPEPDNDKDGIPDLEDNCPNHPGAKSENGCPKEP
jgi:hypothetical protein